MGNVLKTEEQILKGTDWEIRTRVMRGGKFQEIRNK
jgi:hypothetical protein